MKAAHHSFFQTTPSPVRFAIRDLRAAVSVCVASTRRSRASSRLGNDQLFSMLQSGDGCLARHRRKLFQKLDERVSAFQIIEQILERHPGAAEDRGSAKDVRVSHDDSIGGEHHTTPFRLSATSKYNEQSVTKEEEALRHFACASLAHV